MLQVSSPVSKLPNPEYSENAFCLFALVNIWWQHCFGKYLVATRDMNFIPRSKYGRFYGLYPTW